MKQSTVMKRLGAFVSVENMTSSNGNDVPNQFIINFKNGRVFQSYSSIIVVKIDGKVYLGSDWDYSQTTGKYRNQFLGRDKKETQDRLKSGQYQLLK